MKLPYDLFTERHVSDSLDLQPGMESEYNWADLGDDGGLSGHIALEEVDCRT